MGIDEARIIAATFSDFKIVKGRKQLQLIMEVPIEKMEEVLRVLGPPGVHEDKWCAIARLNEKPSTPIEPKQAETAAPSRSCTCHPSDNPPVPCAEKYALSECVAAAAPSRPRRPFHELPLSEQCALRGKDKQFLEWMGYDNEGDFLKWVHFHVASRKLLDSDAKARKWWIGIEAEYLSHIATLQHAETFR